MDGHVPDVQVHHLNSPTSMEPEDILSSAFHERFLIDSLTSFEEFSKSSISSETVLTLSEKLAPSFILGDGGILFELFFLRNAPEKMYNTFIDLVAEKKKIALTNIG